MCLYCKGDPNRDNIDPDLLMQGAETYIKESRLHELFDFLGRYVCKAHKDDVVLRCLKGSPGFSYSYLDVIMPSDIAYVIALMSFGIWTCT